MRASCGLARRAHQRVARGEHEILEYAAFTTDPAGGNPAGVVLDASGLDDAQMLAIAADLGHSKTAFVTAPYKTEIAPPGRGFKIHYFSALAEVPFCGHATVATAAALAEQIGPGDLLLATGAGDVPVSVVGEGGELRATLTSVTAYVEDVEADDVAEALGAPRLAGGGPRPRLAAADRLRRGPPPRARRRHPGSGWPTSITTSRAGSVDAPSWT